MRYYLLPLCGIFSLSVACGDKSGGTVEKAQAEKVYAQLVKQSQKAQNAASGSPLTDDANDNDFGGEDFEFDFQDTDPQTYTEEIDCTDGGSVKFNSTTTVSLNPFKISSAGTTTYNACNEDNVTADGETEDSFTFDQTGFEMSFSGTLTFSGEVTGSCDIDIEFSASASSEEPVVTGTICGYDIDELDIEVTVESEATVD